MQRKILIRLIRVEGKWEKVGSITLEEAEERIVKLEHELEELKNKNKINSMCGLIYTY